MACSDLTEGSSIGSEPVTARHGQVRRLRVCMHTKDTSGRHLGGVIFFEKYIIIQLLWNMIILN